jgi:hypothetical protein
MKIRPCAVFRIPVIFTLLLSIAQTPFAPAREIESWSYERLFKESDLVVIATAQATADSNDAPPDNRWKSALVGQQTTFAIDAVLKGKRLSAPLAVLHFKLKPGVVTQDGPLLVTFRTKGPAIEGGGKVKYSVQLGTPQYLLFLKTADHERFALVSGQIDPELSVKEIYAPLPDVMDQK